MKTRLIIVEGIPGSGKTTTATFIKGFLEEKRIPARLYTEGDLNHPAYFESVACLGKDFYRGFLQKHYQSRMLLEKHTVQQGNDYLVAYGKMKLKSNSDDDEMIRELKRFDIYDVS